MTYLRTLTSGAILAVAVSMTGAERKEVPLPEAKQAQIRAEVLQAVKIAFTASEQMDVEAFRSFGHKSPEFLFATPDGTSYGFEELMAMGKEMSAEWTGQKFITQKESVIVLAPDAALYFWQGRNDVIKKDGVVLRADPYCCTYLYRKIKGQWKFYYGHESGLPYQPVKVEDSKKGQ